MEYRKCVVLVLYLITQTLPSIRGSIHQPNTWNQLPFYSPFYRQLWQNMNSTHKIPKLDNTILTSVETNYSKTINNTESYELISTNKSEISNSSIVSKDVMDENSNLPSQININNDVDVLTNGTKPNVEKSKNLTLKRVKDFNSIFNNMSSFKDRFDKLKLMYSSQMNRKLLNSDKAIVTGSDKNKGNNNDSARTLTELQHISSLNDKSNNELIVSSNITHEIEKDVGNKFDENLNNIKTDNTSILQTNADVEAEIVPPILENPIQLQKTTLKPANFEAILAKIRKHMPFSGYKNRTVIAHNSQNQTMLENEMRTKPVLPPKSIITDNKDNEIPVTQVDNTLKESHAVNKPQLTSTQPTLSQHAAQIDVNHKPEISYGNISPDVFYKLSQQLYASNTNPTIQTTVSTKSDHNTQEVIATAAIITDEDHQIVEEWPLPTITNVVDHNHHTIDQPQYNNNNILKTPPKVVVDSQTIIQTSNVDHQELLKETIKSDLTNNIVLLNHPINNVKKETLINPSVEEIRKLLLSLNNLGTTSVYEDKAIVGAVADHVNMNLISNPIAIPIDSHKEAIEAPMHDKTNSIKPVATIQSPITKLHLPEFKESGQRNLNELVALENHAKVDQKNPNALINQPIPILQPLKHEEENVEEIFKPDNNLQINLPLMPDAFYTHTYNPYTLYPKIINVDAILSNIQKQQDKQLNKALEMLLLSDLLKKKFCNPKLVNTLLTLLYLR